MTNLIRKNVRGLLALALPVLIPAVASAEPLILSAPTSQPPAATVPASPAQNAPAPQAAMGRVLVLPFLAINPNEASPWLGKSIQDSLSADLMSWEPDHIVKSDQPAGSVDAAIALARQNGAQYVISGGFVTVDHEARITGQILDAWTGRTVAGLKVTGDPTQIFHLEDALAMQVKDNLMPGQTQAPAPQAPAQQQPIVAAPQGQPSYDTAAPPTAPGYYSTYASPPPAVVYDNTSNYPSYGYSGYADVGYPNYGYGYGYPVGIGLGFYYGGGYGYGYGHHYRGNRYVGNYAGYGGSYGSVGGGGAGAVTVRSGGFRSASIARSGVSHGGGGVHGGSSGFHGGGHGGGHR